MSYTLMHASSRIIRKILALIWYLNGHVICLAIFYVRPNETSPCHYIHVTIDEKVVKFEIIFRIVGIFTNRLEVI